MIKFFNNKKKDTDMNLVDLYCRQVKIIKDLEKVNKKYEEKFLKDMESVKKIIDEEYPSIKQATISINDPDNFLFSVNESINNLENIDNLPNKGLLLAESLYKFSCIHIKDDKNKKLLSIVYFAYAKVLEIEMHDLLISIGCKFQPDDTLGSFLREFNSICESNNLKYESIDLNKIRNKRNAVAHRGEANLEDIEYIRKFFFNIDNNEKLSIGDPYKELSKLIQLLKNRK